MRHRSYTTPRPSRVESAIPITTVGQSGSFNPFNPANILFLVSLAAARSESRSTPLPVPTHTLSPEQDATHERERVVHRTRRKTVLNACTRLDVFATVRSFAATLAVAVGAVVGWPARCLPFP